MTIERRFEPDPEALDRVVEILYRLLVEPLARDEAATNGSHTETAESPCFPTEYE